MKTRKIFVNEKGQIGIIKRGGKNYFYEEAFKGHERVFSIDKDFYSKIKELTWETVDELDIELFNKDFVDTVKFLKEINTCWHGKVYDFLELECNEWLKAMRIYYRIIVKDEPSQQQIESWKDSFNILQRELGKIVNTKLYLKDLGIIFEFVLPYSGGKRPDVILISNNFIFLIEFKTSFNEQKVEAQFNQIDFYCRNLKYYHSYCADKVIIPILLPTKLHKEEEIIKGNILMKSQYDTFLNIKQLNNVEFGLNYIENFLKGQYKPLPSIVELAESIFNKNRLPGVNDSNINIFEKIEKKIIEVIEDSRKNNKKSFIFITGVPGAGKTYLGLDIVHNIKLDNENICACYLSGNNALIATLKETLGKDVSDVFIKKLSTYKKQYNNNNKIPTENVIVYDEGQRSWQDEPEIFRQVSEKLLKFSREKWCCIIYLVGNGQELQTVESGDVSKWNSILDNSWRVFGPSDIINNIRSSEKVKEEEFNLKVSLRGHLNKDLSNWVDAVLNNNFLEAYKIKEKMPESYKIFITDNLQKAKEHCRDIYYDSDTKKIMPNKRFGLIASSFTQQYKVNENKKIKFLVDGRNGLPKDDYSNLIGKWFCSNPYDKNSCCQFNLTANEYDIQGLELDMPILCWNDDLIIKEGIWNFNYKYYNNKINIKNNKKKKEFINLINTYRVLLTRGRDGVIIVVPKELNRVFKELSISGAEML